MTGHRIRLRGGWERHDLETGQIARITLPASLPTESHSSMQLVRAFNKPLLDAARESLWLDLRRVPGIRSVRLNDEEIARPADGLSALSLPIENARESRNVLVLELQTRSAGAPLADDSLWGEIALVITPLEG